jgi:hypothetical protein
MAVNCSGLTAGVTSGTAPVGVSRNTPVPEAASTFDPAATTPEISPSPPDSTTVHEVPFHSAA